MIILVGGIKGGSGKTTLAVNLAIMETLRHQNTLLIDADAQDTASYFMAQRGKLSPGLGFANMKMHGKEIITKMPQIKKVYSSIIIDAGGGDTESQRAALTVADKLLIPFVPSAFDIWTMDKLDGLLKNARHFNPKLKGYSVLNRAESQGPDNDMAGDALRSYAGIQFLDMNIGARKAFRRATASGRALMELPNAPSQAKGEISLLHQFLFLEDGNV